MKYGVKGYYPHQPMHLVADLKELALDTGWEPTTLFIDGIKQII